MPNADDDAPPDRADLGPSDRHDTATPTYFTRLDHYTAERDAHTQRWNRIANLRLLAAVAGAAAIGWGWWADSWLATIAGAVVLVGFVILAVYHGRLGRRRRRAAALVEINREAIARVARDWTALPLRHQSVAPPDHPFALDLDLFGRASLAQLLETPATPMGEATLAAWLLAPAAPATVRQRQVAVAELAPLLDFRQELELRGRLAAPDRVDPTLFLEWAEGARWLDQRAWLRWWAWIGPGLLVATAAAFLSGLTDRHYWLIPLAINLIVSQTVARPAYEVISRVASRHRALLGDAAQLDLLVSTTFTSAPVRQLQSRLHADNQPAPVALRRLSRLAALPIPPSSPLSLPIQALTLWDVHVLSAMERWQQTAGQRVRDWLAALGEAEALAALSTLAYDNPDWVMPEVAANDDAFRAEGLGHPLLPHSERVVNDVTVGPPGTFLLVTGSNMSGKSTLLRSIGVNAVLAGAGSPVCATACQLPPVSLWTSARVQDSLERGVSFFMAELQRLKLVVDAADRQGAHGGPRVLYLLDEILQGTNTAERQIAARRIIGHLVERGAIGAVSTHDLALADAPDLALSARPVHFTDTIGEEVNGAAPGMSFDYRLRPGVATSTNALRLMELVGLSLAEPTPGVSATQDEAERIAASSDSARHVQSGLDRP